eukprot:3427186-Lingulodinium_polyedra.AAC.1
MSIDVDQRQSISTGVGQCFQAKQCQLMGVNQCQSVTIYVIRGHSMTINDAVTPINADQCHPM